MKERPILFSGEMVRAILDGRKTQTRRLITPQPPPETTHVARNTADVAFVPWRLGTSTPSSGHRTGSPIKCPYGVVGDRLWVRETCALNQPTWRAASGVVYRATDDKAPEGDERWRPAIHMPRWASRITLEVTAVRAERLQAISEEDARAEGVDAIKAKVPSARDAFMYLWDSINGERAAWASNPWVFVVGFRVVDGAKR